MSGLAWLMATTALAASGAAHAQAPQSAPPPPPPGATSTAQPGGQPVAAPAQTGVVQRILIQGNVRIEQATILSYLPIQPGDVIGRAQMDLAVKTLFKTDLFSDVGVDLSANGDLIVRVVENPIINQVVFEGNDNLKDDKLRDEVTVRPRGIFTKGRVQSDVQRIVELYRRSGRIGVTVTPEIVELPQKRVDLIFEINEGPTFSATSSFPRASCAGSSSPRKAGSTASSAVTTTTIPTGWTTIRNSCASSTATAATMISG
jgi:outer membrane protein insertion porin family